jgi:hypothetical protein
VSPGALGVCVAVALAAEVAAAAPPDPVLVRPDEEGPPPPLDDPPLVAVTPPDLLPPVIPEAVWRAQRRKLKIQAGLSWTFAAIGLVGVTVPVVWLGLCASSDNAEACPGREAALITAPIFAAMAAASLVPAAIYTDRLLYLRTPERAPQLGVAPGGLVLRF